jgi:predicted DNA-binding protein
MSSQRPPKKSETLEIRIPYPTKTAFMEKAKAEGRAASEIVREQIDAYLGQEPEPQSLADKAVVLIRQNLRGAGLMLAGAGSALAISLAAAPATAMPGSGGADILQATSAANGADPLMIVVDLPAGGLTATQLGELVGQAFAKLDKDGNGIILPGE